MNLVLVHESEVSSGATLRLSGRRAQHLLRVCRVQQGQRIRVGVVHRQASSTVVLRTGDDWLELEALSPTSPLAPRPLCDLVVAIPRPKAVARLIEDAAAMGVGTIDFVNAWRVEKPYLTAAALSSENRTHAAILGCEQGGHTYVPSTAVHRFFVPFVDELPKADSRQRIALDPRAKTTLSRCSRGGPALLAFGPEGGWIDTERASLAAAGFTLARLGPSVLRSGAAVVAALAQVDALRERHLQGRA